MLKRNSKLQQKTPLKPSGGLNKTGKGLSKGKGLKKVSEAGKAKRIEKNDRNEKMIEMFFLIWKERPHICKSCNRYLGTEPSTAFFDHLLLKSKYPEFALEPENIFLCCMDCHSNKEAGRPSRLHQEAIDAAKLKFIK